MAFCTNCGARIVDTARFCPECGSPVAVVEQNTPQPGYQQPEYQQPNADYADPDTAKYHTLGGWLLFFTICWGLSALSSVSTIFSSFSSLGTLFRYNQASLAFPTFILILMSLVAIATDVLMIVCIVKRAPKFLRYYQILSFVNIGMSVLVSIFYAAAARSYGGILLSSGIAGVFAGVLGLVLMTLYFCKSVRVRTYMGTTEYLDTALFKIGA